MTSLFLQSVQFIYYIVISEVKKDDIYASFVRIHKISLLVLLILHSHFREIAHKFHCFLTIIY